MKITLDIPDNILEYYAIAAELNKISGAPDTKRNQVIAHTIDTQWSEVLRTAILYSKVSNRTACRNALAKAILDERILYGTLQCVLHGDKLYDEIFQEKQNS